MFGYIIHYMIVLNLGLGLLVSELKKYIKIGNLNSYLQTKLFYRYIKYKSF